MICMSGRGTRSIAKVARILQITCRHFRFTCTFQAPKLLWKQWIDHTIHIEQRCMQCVARLDSEGKEPNLLWD